MREDISHKHSDLVHIPFAGFSNSGRKHRQPDLPQPSFQEHHALVMRQDKQHAVITGGTGSLGRAIAQALDADGFIVAAPGSRELDVRDISAVRAYFLDRSVDLLVCSAGITRDAPLAKLTEQSWDETWNINYEGSLLCANAALSSMVARGSGHIIFISSFSAHHPPIGQTAYASAKAALLGLVSDLAVRHGTSNIRVNAILPGFLETAMTASVTGKRRVEILDHHTLGRLNTCENAAKFIRFLHREMPHTSGQIFQLDSRLHFW
jgi:3-oxoacyl-[acyl-carrier protein] reductase